MPVHTEALQSSIEDALPTDIMVTYGENDDHDLMGPSVLEHMKISMVHVLPAEF